MIVDSFNYCTVCNSMSMSNNKWIKMCMSQYHTNYNNNLFCSANHYKFDLSIKMSGQWLIKVFINRTTFAITLYVFFNSVWWKQLQETDLTSPWFRRDVICVSINENNSIYLVIRTVDVVTQICVFKCLNRCRMVEQLHWICIHT